MNTNIRDIVNETFGHRFWDDQNQKIIRSTKITFNEHVVYKDRSNAKLVGIEPETKKSKFVNLDELPESIVHNKVQEDEALSDSQKGKQILEVNLDKQHSLTKESDDEVFSRDLQH